jgi:hypothetical protein
MYHSALTLTGHGNTPMEAYQNWKRLVAETSY